MTRDLAQEPVPRAVGHHEVVDVQRTHAGDPPDSPAAACRCRRDLLPGVLDHRAGDVDVVAVREQLRLLGDPADVLVLRDRPDLVAGRPVDRRLAAQARVHVVRIRHEPPRLHEPDLVVEGCRHACAPCVVAGERAPTPSEEKHVTVARRARPHVTGRSDMADGARHGWWSGRPAGSERSRSGRSPDDPTSSSSAYGCTAPRRWARTPGSSRASTRSGWRPPTTPTPSSPCGPTASSTPRTARSGTRCGPRLRPILEAGINIVTVSTRGLVYPPGYDADLSSPSSRRGRRAGERDDLLVGHRTRVRGRPPPAAAHARSPTGSRRSTRTELFLYDGYPVTFDMFDVMGFGMPMDYEPMLATPGGPIGVGARRSA